MIPALGGESQRILCRRPSSVNNNNRKQKKPKRLSSQTAERLKIFAPEKGEPEEGPRARDSL